MPTRHTRMVLRLTLLLLVASGLACSDDEDEREERHCAKDGRFVDDKLCDAAEQASGASGSWAADGRSPPPAGGHVIFVPQYRYVYVPHSYYYGPGSSAAGFHQSFSPGSGHAAVSSGRASSFGAVSRGGFGGTGAAHAGGGSAS